jgi:hypothetical protein
MAFTEAETAELAAFREAGATIEQVLAHPLMAREIAAHREAQDAAARAEKERLLREKPRPKPRMMAGPWCGWR